MLTEMNAVVDELEKMIGPLSLLMTLGAEEISDPKLTLVVSAVALDRAVNLDAVKLVMTCVKKNVPADAQSLIARVNVKSTNDPLVQAITGVFNVSRGPLITQNNSFNGIYVANANIYKSARYDRPRN